MPQYMYKCSECDFEIEITQRFNDEPIKECSRCGGAVTKVIFAVPVHYKGPGFYTTESRGITGKRRKPNIKVGTVSDLPPEEQERAAG